VGDRKKHDSSPTAPQEPEQNRGNRIQNNGLTGYEQDGDYCINDAMLHFEPVQPAAQNMKDQKEITGNKNGINCQLGCKRAEASGGILFHEQEIVEALKPCSIEASDCQITRLLWH
jgi:hypothetical protein